MDQAHYHVSPRRHRAYRRRSRTRSYGRFYHYKARVYDPKIGRFLQTDPIGYDDNLNMYAYVGGNPIGKVDPLMELIASGKVDRAFFQAFFAKAIMGKHCHCKA